MKNSILFCFLLLTTICLAQPDIPIENIQPFECGFEEMQVRAFQNGQVQRKWQQFEENYQISAQQTSLQLNETVYKIPTVIHIIHNNRAIGTVHNPTDERAKATIEWTNKQLRDTSDPDYQWGIPFAGADSKIELCLASVDPQGNPTTGINRYNLPNQAVDPTDEIDSYNWDVSRYYNIFVVEELTNVGGYYCSYADHVVVESIRNNFSFPLVTHETGHYFSLYHTFNDCANSNCLTQGDFVCDTPPGSLSTPACDNPENTCQTDDDDTNNRNPYRPTNLGGLGDQSDFSRNFMGYSFCFPRFFSEGQKVRMRTNIETMRLNMVNNSELLCSTCSDDLTLDDTQLTNQVFSAQNNIISTSIIDNNAIVNYYAGQSITLQTDFCAKAGTNFSATILADPCNLDPPAIVTLNTTTDKAEIGNQALHLNTIFSPVNLTVFPNPFTYETTIQFTLNEPSPLQLTLYNLNGQKISTILQKNNYSTGQHQLELHADKLPVGVYFLTLQTVNERITKKLIIQQQ